MTGWGVGCEEGKERGPVDAETRGAVGVGGAHEVSEPVDDDWDLQLRSWW